MSTTPKTLTVTECHQLLNELILKRGTRKQFRKGIRNYTMALLMLDAGLRVGEVIRLYQSDLFFARGVVRCLIVRAEIAKNKTERIVPISSRLSAAILEMFKNWWSSVTATDEYFAFYQVYQYRPVTTRQVERIIRAAALKSIGRPVHPHVLRHTFASRLMRKVNGRIVQELLGHKNMSSTQIYTHPNQEDLTEAINQIDNSTAGPAHVGPASP